VDESRVRIARAPVNLRVRDGTTGADIRCGDATALPWPDGAFDSSIKRRVHLARESPM
jgi:hypothetical protein